MIKYKQKEIKSFVNSGIAVKIDNFSADKIENDILKRRLEKIGYSAGVYGINGGLVRDEDTNELFAITSRCVNLFRLF